MGWLLLYPLTKHNVCIFMANGHGFSWLLSYTQSQKVISQHSPITLLLRQLICMLYGKYVVDMFFFSKFSRDIFLINDLINPRAITWLLPRAQAAFCVTKKLLLQKISQEILQRDSLICIQKFKVNIWHNLRLKFWQNVQSETISINPSSG